MHVMAAEELERELRAGAPVTLLDVRDADAFAKWHIDAAGVPLLNVPSAVLREDASAAAGLPSTPLRILCTRGNTALTVAEELERMGLDVTCVTGGMIAWSRVLTPGPVDIGTATTVVQLRREARGCLSYLIANGREALVVDPAPGVEAYLGEAAARGVTITRVFDTHVHADHLSGVRELCARTGAVRHVSAAGVARGIVDADAVTPVRDGDRIPLGDAEVTVVSLPGHTSDNTGLLVDGAAIVLGDSLFSDAVARPDLEVGDEGAAEAAHLLHRTLHERVLPLGDDIVLLPCHYPGGRLDGPVAPTLGEVRRSLPLLDLDADAFTERVLSEMPPRPDNYLAIIAVNLGEPWDEAERLEVGANNCASGPGTT